VDFGVGFQSGWFEELAMPLFDQLYNVAHWLTQNREMGIVFVNRARGP
jgi:hypothetical protein